MTDSGKKKPQQETPELVKVEEALKETDPHLFRGIKPEVKQRILSGIFTMVSIQRSHSGPLPSPETLEEYERILPGAAERIFTAFEKQYTHRHNLESDTITSQNKQSGRGQFFGLIISSLAIISGFVLTLSEHPYVGGSLCGTTVVALATIFVLGKKDQRKNLKEKD